MQKEKAHVLYCGRVPGRLPCTFTAQASSCLDVLGLHQHGNRKVTCLETIGFASDLGSTLPRKRSWPFLPTAAYNPLRLDQGVTSTKQK